MAARDVGIDVGGTFTDLAAVDRESGRLRVLKVASTPRDQSLGILRALERAELPAGELGSLVHGTTVATNAILERQGARCGLITTRGFRDVLELRRRDRPRPYGLTGWFEPLVPRELRLEVAERMDPAGHEVIPLDEDGVRAAARRLRGVEVIVVSFLHAYANPRHEQRARELVQQEAPEAFVVLASEVLPEFREFERTSTAVLNGYVQPVVGRYLAALATRLRAAGYPREVLLVQSNGGLMSSELAQRLPVHIVLSGPAAGVVAGASIAQAAGLRNCITADVGGTSFDVSLVAGGQPRVAEERLVEYGLPVRVPHIDIATIGAGGGSLAWLDRGGMLRVGPRSAGAYPGPAAYGMGGAEPTVTDAQLVLGRINPERPIGGPTAPALDLDLAHRAVERCIARPLGLSVEAASLAIVQVANSAMAGSIRGVSVERGFDPRDFALVAFGGAGPLHACALVREVDLGQALVPPYPGVTSALGCVLADFRHDFVQTVHRPLAQLDLRAAYQVLAELLARGRRLLDEEGAAGLPTFHVFQADMAYEGQIHTLTVPLPTERPPSAEPLARRFTETYRREYGHVLERFPIVVANLRVTVVARRARPGLAAVPAEGTASLADAYRGHRRVLFEAEFTSTPVFERAALPAGARLPSPCVVEQADTTILVEPGMSARLDALGNLLLQQVAP